MYVPGPPGFFFRARRCATCEHWGGKRTEDLAKLRITVPRRQSPGECLAPKGPLVGAPMLPDMSCEVWVLWTPFRSYDGPASPPRPVPPDPDPLP